MIVHDTELYVVTLWNQCKYFFFIGLCALPFLCFDLETLKPIWFAPFIGLLGGAIPAMGIPVAGGIFFFPMLSMLNIQPKEIVAFTSFVQSFGCGVFTPLNRLTHDPHCIDWNSVRMTLIPSSVGISISLAFLPPDTQLVILTFVMFCFLLLCQCIWTIVNDTTTSDLNVMTEIRSLSFSERISITFLSIVGGLISGYIGVGFDKILFAYTTVVYGLDHKVAAVTFLSIMGWISIIAAILHAFCSKTLNIGCIPYPIALCTLPGLFWGSYVGAYVSQKLGKRQIYVMFSVLLAFDILSNLKKL